MGKKLLLGRYLYILVALAVIFSLVNVFVLQTRGEKWKEAQEIIQEQLRPAVLEVTKIGVPNCDDCYDIEAAMAELKKQNVNITKETAMALDAPEAKELIRKYAIKKLPTMLIQGEINKSEQLNRYFENIGEIKENTVVYTALKPLYYDLQSSRVVGRVSLIQVVDSSCELCSSLSQVAETLKGQEVSIRDERSVEYTSKEGQSLIQAFGIQRIPALLISKEIDYYEPIQQQLSQLDITEKEGFYAIHTLLPPYRDVKENKIVGFVELIMLEDASCTTCFDVIVNKQILARLGMVITSENTYDISSPEGKEQIAKYSITSVPIILVSPEANSYPAFLQAWKGVGSIEGDGWFVMRNPGVLGMYKDLEKNEVIDPRKQRSNPATGQEP
ncbi:hypothetical protein HYS48_01070 [Candidatus Woesearchaeota archaeon]|nr:hypothetical protein [Candidatus Woesearchaeota archaeon]